MSDIDSSAVMASRRKLWLEPVAAVSVARRGGGTHAAGLGAECAAAGRQ
jgi:hypothetical protein